MNNLNNESTQIVINRFGSELDHLMSVIAYDWDNMDEHHEWLRTAELAEIKGWAESVQAEIENGQAAREAGQMVDDEDAS